MERIKTQNSQCLLKLIAFFALLAGFLYTNLAAANQLNSTMPSTQLAYFVGFHNYYGAGNNRPNYQYEAPRQITRSYWTGWRYMGRGCQRNCLMNSWNSMIRCETKCCGDLRGGHRINANTYK